MDGPGHPFRLGVRVITAGIAKEVEFVAIKLGILPVPLAASPIAVLELVQL